MKKLKINFIAIFLVVGISEGISQDIHYSQFYSNDISMNPASTGLFTGIVRGVISYKDQWRSVANPYKTFSVALDHAFLQDNKSLDLGVGLLLNSDKAGAVGFGTNGLNLLLSSIVPINKDMKIAGGINIGYNTRTLNAGDARWGTGFDNDGTYNTSYVNETSDFGGVSYLDFSGGILFNYNSSGNGVVHTDATELTIGASYSHINKPVTQYYTYGNDNISAKLLVNADAIIPVSGTSFSIIPSGFVSLQGKSREIVFGSLFKYQIKEGSKYTGLETASDVSLGVHYRMSGSVIVGSMLQFTQFGIGISYDVNTSKLRAATKYKGGVEIMFRYVLPLPNTYGKSRI
jgi:type IX secretion system PorP/SprF family membrane protein